MLVSPVITTLSFEQFQNITESPIRTCPECGRRKVRRLISGGSGFLFKGSGFYITDYRSDGYKQAAKLKKKKEPESQNPNRPVRNPVRNPVPPTRKRKRLNLQNS